ncbi:MAG: M1 family aminopeptidase, partial [Anaerolineales bacterium]
LDEALTEWSVALYAEDAYGTYAEYIDIFRQEYQQWEQERGISVIGQPAPAYSTAAYSPVVYRKGAIFFHRLREQLGDAAFFAALRAYFTNYQYDIATPFDLQSILEAQHGAELDALFFEWVGYSN